MKIVHALGWYFPESLGGTEVYVAGLVQRLLRAGYQVAVAAPLRGLQGTETYEYDSVTVFRYPVPRDPTREECQSRVPARGAEQFTKWLVSQRPDVLHVHTLSTGLGVFELEAAKDLGIKIVVTNHLGSVGYTCLRGTLMHWGENVCDGICVPLRCSACVLQDGGMPKYVALAMASASTLMPSAIANLPGRAGTALGLPDTIRHNQRLQRRLLAVADRLVVLNHAALNVLLANGAPAHKLEVNYLGTSFRTRCKVAVEKHPTDKPIRLGYFGRFAEIKGIFDLAKAVQSLSKDLEFVLECRGPCNDDASRVALQRLRQMLGGDARVKFCEPVPPEEASEILKSYDVLIVPSCCFENGPTVMYESFAVGTPVIGTRIGAMSEIIQDGVNGRLFVPGQWWQLAEILKEVALDPANTIDRWRRVLPLARTMDDIAADYERTYAAVTKESEICKS